MSCGHIKGKLVNI